MKNELAVFNKSLTIAPKAKEVQLMQGNKYVPIQIQEAKLDDIYSGLWQTRNLKISLMANEVVAEIELGVFHPLVKEWIWRCGVGAVPVQQRKGSQLSDMVNTKIPNALQKNAAAAKAFAFKNACQSLGVTFGRELNRGYEEDVTPNEIHLAAIGNATDEALAIISTAKLEELGNLLKQYIKIPGAAKAINARKKELSSLKGLL